MKYPDGSAMFRVPLYAGRILLCTKREAYEQALELFDSEPDPLVKEYSGVMVEVWQGKRTVRKIFVVGWFDNKMDTLVHELAHVTFRALRHAGVRIQHSNDEVYAYLMDALFKASTDAAKRIQGAAR